MGHAQADLAALEAEARAASEALWPIARYYESTEPGTRERAKAEPILNAAWCRARDCWRRVDTLRALRGVAGGQSPHASAHRGSHGIDR